MKRLWIVVLLVFSPIALLSQWSFVGSASAGISEVDNDYMKFYKDSKGKLGTDFSFAARYAVWKFYVSSGVGFQIFKSQSGYVMTSSAINYNNINPEFSYSNLYIPITVGFRYDRWRIYPIAETGVNIGFSTESKDRLSIGSETTSRLGGSKSTVLSYVVQAGIGYAFSYWCSLEAKFRFTTSGNVSTYKYADGRDYKSTWQYIGGQVSFVVRLPQAE